ncbi:MAG TPA: nitroreductase/quinone reductase family protein [Candidatus Binatia bacterium]|jgi:hypothetical protein|nr:nitroreductase/quinone reductase family protein [Candidatus Binatia bacterium]
MTTTRALPATEANLPLAIRVLRRLKPVMLAVLGSPLHGVLSRDILALSYRGRRSGRTFTLPLSYVTIGEHLYLCTRDSLWARNLRDEPAVEIVLRGRRVPATAHVLDSASEEALAGLRAFLGRNPHTGATLYDVRRGPDESDLRREVLRSTVVRLDR